MISKKSKLLLMALASAAIISNTTHAKGLSDDKVKIGVIADMGGIYADICGKGCVTAAQMAIDDFGGKVLGKPIEIVSADDQNKPDIGSAKTREWIEGQQVDVILGSVASSVTGAITKVATDAKKITLISGSASHAFTTKSCSPYNVHWTYNVIALAKGTVKPAVQAGKKKWFFITADYAFGHALEKVATGVINENGGTVVGSVKVPLGTTDFSSFVLQAQSSGADVVALANAGADFVNSLKTASEFGLTESADVAGLLVFTQNAKALDPALAAGMKLTTGFYWDRDVSSREWSAKFKEKHGDIPSMIHAGAYSAVTHYLESIKAAGTDKSEKVIRMMKDTKPNDFFAQNAVLRNDGRLVHDMYQMRIKGASERKNEDDIFAIEEVIPGNEAFGAMLDKCNFK